MHLLQSGVDLSVIALWLGHENIQTTHQYMDADLESKKRALALLEAPRVKQPHRRSPQPLMQFLEGLYLCAAPYHEDPRNIGLVACNST